MSQSVTNFTHPSWLARTLKSFLGYVPKRLRGHIVKHLGKHTLPSDFVAEIPDRGSFAFQRNVWDLSRYFGIFELPESAFLKQVVGSGMQVIDVGANVGWYTALFFQQIGPKGRLLSIEPDSSNFARLEKYYALQGSPSRFQLIQAAVGAQEGVLPLYLNQDSGANTIVPELGQSYGNNSRGIVEVQIKTLDQLAQQFHFDTVDFLKIDVERAELLVLQGAKELLQDKRIKRLFIEITDLADADNINQSWIIDQLLRSYGLRGYTFEISSQGKIQSLTEFTPSKQAHGEGNWRNVLYVESISYLPSTLSTT